MIFKIEIRMDKSEVKLLFCPFFVGKSFINRPANQSVSYSLVFSKTSC